MPNAAAAPSSVLKSLAVWGPGLLVMLADSDAGNVVAAAQAGAQWGYCLLPLLLLLIPVLHMVQELTVRLGIFTQRGYGALVRLHLGPVWAWVSLASLAVAVAGTLVTEFSAVAGIGGMFGLPKALSLTLAVILLLAVAASGSYRRIERIALAIGLFELAFLLVAWQARPDPLAAVADLASIPLKNKDFLYLVAALVGAVFNPWMVFYQQAAVAEKRLRPADYRAERWDTAIGAVLTQVLTAAVLVAAAASLRGSQFNDIGEIGEALTPLLGLSLARPVFAAGVLGASMVAAIIASLSLVWGVRDVTDGKMDQSRKGFFVFYAGCVTGAALLVGCTDALVPLVIGAQVLNALLLPLVLGCLLVLARKALPPRLRLSGWQWPLSLGTAGAITATGLIGALAGLLTALPAS